MWELHAVGGSDSGDAAPAGDGVVGAEAARMPSGSDAACGDGRELSARRVALPVVGLGVAAPAGDGAVGAEAARTATAYGDGGELSARRITLPLSVVTPACDGAVGA